MQRASIRIGIDVGPGDSFVVAINNYRQTGGGGYSMLRDAPLVYDKQQDIRDLVIGAVREKELLHESTYDDRNWSILKPVKRP
ncbi:MAG: hypothetical protein ABI338_08445 [Gemmatimonadaceae bacterium]